MLILNARDVRASRFESSASNDTETNILKGPFVNISRIVGISPRGGGGGGLPYKMDGDARRKF